MLQATFDAHIRAGITRLTEGVGPFNAAVKAMVEPIKNWCRNGIGKDAFAWAKKCEQAEQSLMAMERHQAKLDGSLSIEQLRAIFAE